MLRDLDQSAMASETKLRRRCFGGQRFERIQHADTSRCLLPALNRSWPANQASFRREAESSRLTSGWSPPPGDLGLMQLIRDYVGLRDLAFFTSGDREP